MISEAKSQLASKTPIDYTHAKVRSFNARAIHAILAMAGIRKKVEKKISRDSRPKTAAKIPHSFQKKFDVVLETFEARTIYTISPKEKKSDKTVLFFHGGGYVENILKFHWDFIEEMVELTGATFVIPDYPLAPQFTCKENFDYISKMYDHLLNKGVSTDNLFFMGDSAGGGLALSFSQFLKSQERKLPKQLILLSPWLDVSLTNADKIEVVKKDKMLSINGLKNAGKAYAGTIDLQDYRVSPIYGDFSGLPKISIFIGTYDILVSDCKLLREQLGSQEISLNFFEYPRMFHDWMLVKYLKEAKSARKQIALLMAE